MSNLDELCALIVAETVTYRKGPEVEAKSGAVHIYAMPPAPEDAGLVDVHFMKVGFTGAGDADGFRRVLVAAAAESGEYGPANLESGPSYITLGGFLGSQDLALRLLALGEHYGVWKVITPTALGLTGQAGDVAAGAGYVMCTGLRAEAVGA